MQTSRYAYLHSVTVFKNHKKVSFNSASEASYVYILSGQMFIKNAKNGPFGRVFENLKLLVKQRYQTQDRSLLIGQKLVENAKIETFK